jgi:transcriptional regulator with XRE-family HTH domain
MKERILEFLKHENKSSAQLAEEIGVQPSGISHILSGRNNPSLDFVLKMLDKYKFLSSDWLLFGKGTMYKDFRLQTLFDANADDKGAYNEIIDKKDKVPPESGQENSPFQQNSELTRTQGISKPSAVTRIVWFYGDNSFEEYYPKV